MTSSRNVAAAKVGNRGYPGVFGDHMWDAYLQSEGQRRSAWRSVSDGLAVAANGTDAGAGIAKALNEGIYCSCCE